MKKKCINNFLEFSSSWKQGKKIYILEQKPEMGYCPFEHWLGWAQGSRHDTGVGALGARALGWQAGRRRRWGARARAQALGRAGAAGRQAQALGRVRLAGRAAGKRGARGLARAVHLVHSARF